MNDPEIEAMSKLTDALGTLDAETQARVLRWATARYGFVSQPVAQPQAKTETMAIGSSSYSDFASLYDAANPDSGNDRALLAGFWLQEIQGNADWDSLAANALLKNVGRGLVNIAENLTRLMNAMPRLVIQTQKSGASKQGRKRYKLTTEGIRRIKQLITKTNSSQGGESGQH